MCAKLERPPTYSRLRYMQATNIGRFPIQVTERFVNKCGTKHTHMEGNIPFTYEGSHSIHTGKGTWHAQMRGNIAYTQRGRHSTKYERG